MFSKKFAKMEMTSSRNGWSLSFSQYSTYLSKVVLRVISTLKMLC
jgi:hypothetical protein